MTNPPPDDPTTRPLTNAVEVFVRGFAFTRSFTHPYLVERVGPLWVLRDAPRTRGNYRTEEWVSVDTAPATVDALARAGTRGGFAICALCARNAAPEALRDRFKALGYRLTTTEPLMVHDLQQIPVVPAPATIARVLDEPLAARLAKAARARQLTPSQLTVTAPLRQYVALVDAEVVGWVRSIVVHTGDDLGRAPATWCTDMYVRPEFRRRGIGRALLSQLLHDDRAHGARQAVLLATHTGAKLYSTVGYEQIGTLLLFSPRAKAD